MRTTLLSPVESRKNAAVLTQHRKSPALLPLELCWQRCLENVTSGRRRPLHRAEVPSTSSAYAAVLCTGSRTWRKYYTVTPRIGGNRSCSVCAATFWRTRRPSGLVPFTPSEFIRVNGCGSPLELQCCRLAINGSQRHCPKEVRKLPSADGHPAWAASTRLESCFSAYT